MAFDHRPLKPEDAPQICSFAQTAEELFFFFPKAEFPLTPQTLVAEASQRHEPTVALDGNRVVGYVNFLKVVEKRYCTIGNLVVAPAYRRKGVARFLTKRMVELAAQDYGAKFVRVSCFSHNAAAYQMYHGLGFRPDDMAQRTTPEGEPVLLVNMVLRCRRPNRP